MTVKTLKKGAESVNVDAGSSAEAHWMSKGYVAEGEEAPAKTKDIPKLKLKRTKKEN